MEAGQLGVIGPSSAPLTAFAFRISGVKTITLFGFNNAWTVKVMADSGTESSEGKCPSLTCWRRQARSSSFMILTKSFVSKSEERLKNLFEKGEVENPEIYEAWKKSKKKSDMADALCMAVDAK